jgi:hypothetical protein
MKKRLLYGTIVSGKQKLATGVKFFTVDYTKSSLAFIHKMNLKGGGSTSVFAKLKLSEASATGSALLFEELHVPPTDCPVCLTTDSLKWMVPDSIDDDAQRCKRTLLFRGTKIELKARQSEIPGAGLGTFVRVTALYHTEGQSKLILRPGEMLDLGIYAPLRKKRPVCDCNDN